MPGRSLDFFQNFNSHRLDDPKEVEKLHGVLEDLVSQVLESKINFLNDGSYLSEEKVQELKEKISELKTCVQTRESRLFRVLLGDCCNLEEVLNRYELSDEKVRIDLVEKRHGLNQQMLIPKLSTYLKHRNPQYDEEEIKKGLCHGLTQLYCYYQFLEQEQTFFSRVAEVIASDIPISEGLEDKEYSLLSDEELRTEHLCNDLLYLHGQYEGGSQIDALNSLKAVSDQTSVHELSESLEFVSSFPYNRNTESYPSLESTLQKIFKADQDKKKFLILSTLDHAFGISYENGKCTLYNPNTAKRPKPFKMEQKSKRSAKELSRQLIKSLCPNKMAISLGIKVVSNSVLPETQRKVGESLKKNFDIGTQESFNQVDPLHIALVEASDSTVLDLIQEGANVNKVSSKGKSPLDLACYFGREGLVETLIETGARVNNKKNKNTSPLHSATLRGHPEIMKLLLKQHADPNFKAHEDTTPLHLAALHKDSRATQVLLDAGANIHLVNSHGYTALHVAAENDCEDVINKLLKRDPTILSRINADCRTALHLSSMRGQSLATRALLAHGENPNHLTHQRQTPLHFAANGGDVRTINVLVEAGGDINAIDKDGKTPLHFACLKGNLKAVNAIISHGAMLNVPDKKGHTPMRIAILTNRSQIVEALIKEGSDLNEPDATGGPLLHTAIKSGYFPVIQKLSLAENIDLNARDKHGLTAIHYAAAKGDLQSIDHLLSLGVEINTANENAYTPLHIAAQTGKVEAMALLIKGGALVTNVSENKTTPLHLAAECGSAEGIELLRRQGASINCVDIDGYTPLHTAIEKQNTGAIMHLLKIGAKRTLLTNEGKSISDIAQATKNPSVMQILKHFGIETNPKKVPEFRFKRF